MHILVSNNNIFLFLKKILVTLLLKLDFYSGFSFGIDFINPWLEESLYVA